MQKMGNPAHPLADDRFDLTGGGFDRLVCQAAWISPQICVPDSDLGGILRLPRPVPVASSQGRGACAGRFCTGNSDGHSTLVAL